MTNTYTAEQIEAIATDITPLEDTMNITSDMHGLERELRSAGHHARVDGEILVVRGICDGREVRIIHHAESQTYDKFDVNGAVVGSYTVPAGWRAVDDACHTLCEGASLEELRNKLSELGRRPASPNSPFDPPFTSRANDELSTEHVFDVEDVLTADRRIIGQTGESDEPTRTGFMARTAYYAQWGDVPGQLTGWAGPWPTRAAAEKALRNHRQS